MTERPPKLLRWPEVEAILNGVISRSTVTRLEKKGQFPKRLVLSEQIIVWKEHEILEWLETRNNTNTIIPNWIKAKQRDAA